jgi:hypothetical protein
VRPEGLEPPRAWGHSALNAARLPVPPRAHAAPDRGLEPRFPDPESGGVPITPSVILRRRRDSNPREAFRPPAVFETVSSTSRTTSGNGRDGERSWSHRRDSNPRRLLGRQVPATSRPRWHGMRCAGFEPAVSTLRGWRALRSSNSADAAPRTGFEPVTCTLTGCRALLAALTRRGSCAILGGTTYRVATNPPAHDGSAAAGGYP